MHAFISFKGNQYKTEVGKFLYVPFLGENSEKLFSVNSVLALHKGDEIAFGEPYLRNVSVELSVLDIAKKGDKVIVFKKKRRKGYKKKTGHRQLFSKVIVKSIKENGS